MDNQALKTLCLSLMKADSEEEVVNLLSAAGYWDDQKIWRRLGDENNNYGTIGNQQSRSDAALVEKLINSVDARLMGECRCAGFNPESEKEVPSSIWHAVAQFIDGSAQPGDAKASRVAEWGTDKRTKIARDISLAATGSRRQPSFTISDTGEGQTPEKVPDTLMSISKDNKLKIPFVQGKFNMGGTGALQFCGYRNLQLVVTRRNPKIVAQSLEHDSDHMWSFTIVRRDEPQDNERSSVYRYLAPVDSEQRAGKGGVLRFASDVMSIFHEKNESYVRNSEHGTLVKLYEYQAKGYRSHILLPDGLLSRLDLLLPDPALPIRLHECRDFKGKSGSFDTTLTGLSVRLSDDKKDAMEDGFPTSADLTVDDQKLKLAIYAFKKGRAGTYRKNEGVVFVLNGQTHAVLDTNFFRTKAVNLSSIANSLLVKIDCSELRPRVREDLFMNSRDRLRNDTKMKGEIISALSQHLKNREELRELKNRRHEETIAERLEDHKPLADSLQAIIKQYDTLSSLFLKGKISTPFKKKKVKTGTKSYVGEKYPNYFRFRGKEDGYEWRQGCQIGASCRIGFETDAENEYFSRDNDPGVANLEIERDGKIRPLGDYVVSTNNGLAVATFDMPKDVNVGDEMRVTTTVTDSVRDSGDGPFKNACVVFAQPKIEKKGPTNKKRTKSPSDDDGDDRETESGIALPKINLISEEKWSEEDPPFDKFTALRIERDDRLNSDSENAEVYVFNVNKDNFYLKAELKSADSKEAIVQSQFTHGLVLVGLAMIHDNKKFKTTAASEEESGEGEAALGIEEKVEHVSRALAPFIVPMIGALGSSNLDENFIESASDQSL